MHAVIIPSERECWEASSEWRSLVYASPAGAGDTERTRNMPILLHGDGSFAGQGIVMETLDMSALPEYTVGGTMHIVVNNQVRYPCHARDKLHTLTHASRPGWRALLLARSPVFW
jgi:hypothetical protein